MANEFRHADPGSSLSKDEYRATNAHYADGETTGDSLVFDGSLWKRNPAGTPLADDTYYLGSASKRWKGIYAPIYPVESSAVIIASDAPAGLRAYAAILRAQGLPVYVLDGAADQSEINTARAALSGKAKITIIGPTVNISDAISAARSDTTWHFINCRIVCVTDNLALMFGSGSAVTGVEVILENTVFDGDDKALFGVDFEGNPSQVTFKGTLAVRNCKRGNVYLRYLTKLNFDVINVTGQAAPSSYNQGVLLLNSSNINGRAIITKDCGNYIDPSIYVSQRIHTNYNVQIDNLYSDSLLIPTILIVNMHDFQLGKIYINGNLTPEAYIEAATPDGLDFYGVSYNGTVGEIVANNHFCSGVVFGDNNWEISNISVGQIVAGGCGNRGVVLSHNNSDTHNVQVGSIIVFNNGQKGAAPHGMSMADTSDLQVGQIIAYDDQDTPTQTYPLAFETSNNRALERIRFGLCNFDGCPTKTPKYNVSADAYGNNYPFVNSGTATVANGQTTIVVAHALGKAPTRVYVTPTNSMGNAAKFWVDTIGATEFTINVDADPGATTAIFNWRAVIGDGH